MLDVWVCYVVSESSWHHIIGVMDTLDGAKQVLEAQMTEVDTDPPVWTASHGEARCNRGGTSYVARTFPLVLHDEARASLRYLLTLPR